MPDFKFNLGDRVRVQGDGTYPPFWAGRVGEVLQRADINDNIVKGDYTIYATTPWDERQYAVEFIDDIEICSESWLELANEA